MSKKQLAEVLEKHRLWLLGKKGGVRADLRWADLIEANLSEANLSEANLRGADLRWADLSWANLRGANLSGANLRGANLSGADLSETDGLPSAPVVESIDAAILEAIDGGGCLAMNAWHTCETTHCRAGWAVNLAGEAGKELERKYGTNVAGALIYNASRPGQRIPNWFAEDEEAMADLRKCAAESAKGKA